MAYGTRGSILEIEWQIMGMANTFWMLVVASYLQCKTEVISDVFSHNPHYWKIYMAVKH
jgi:hypothetical protein